MQRASALLLVLANLGLPAGASASAGGSTSAPAPPAVPAVSAVSGGKVFLTQEEALGLAFPKCDLTRRTITLDEKERKRASELAGKDVDVDRRVVYAYEAVREGKPVGTAYFDAHRVRTLDEVLMFVVDPEAKIQRLEMLSFGEPEEYIPRGKWYAQFLGKKLDEDLRLKRDIKGVTGATLTAAATTDAARRTLALHAVIAERKKDGTAPR
jgi:hypothetical protein